MCCLFVNKKGFDGGGKYFRELWEELAICFCLGVVCSVFVVSDLGAILNFVKLSVRLSVFVHYSSSSGKHALELFGE